MNNSIHRKSFVFKANEYHEYRNGVCLSQGKCDTTILGQILDSRGIGIAIMDDNPTNINQQFGLPIFGSSMGGDILKDRVQYGRLPGNLDWEDPNEPVVCEIFNTMTCVRFAMFRPLRIVEFTGRFTQIQS